MIVAFAGRRAGSIEGDLGALALRLQAVLTDLAPTAVVGAAADGADLLIVEAALALDGTQVHLILPTPETVFRKASVEPDWRARFDDALEAARRRGSVTSLGLEDGAEAYRAGNRAFLERASELAGPGERVVVLAVAAEGTGAMVQDLIDAAEQRGVPALRIDPD